MLSPKGNCYFLICIYQDGTKNPHSVFWMLAVAASFSLWLRLCSQGLTFWGTVRERNSVCPPTFLLRGGGSCHGPSPRAVILCLLPRSPLLGVQEHYPPGVSWTHSETRSGGMQRPVGAPTQTTQFCWALGSQHLLLATCSAALCVLLVSVPVCPALWLPVTFTVPSEKTWSLYKYDHKYPPQGTSFPHSSTMVL